VRITHLELTDFRSYASLSVEPEGALTVFVGPNAAGKTNIIESLELIATGRSFRNPQWSEVVRWGADGAKISMKAEGDDSVADVELLIHTSGSRTWRSCGSVKRRTLDATRFVPAVTFTPDDLTIVKGPAERRRSTLDLLGDQLSVTYGALRREYGRVVRQRNAALKEGADRQLLDPWTEQLVALGSKLSAHRRRLAGRIMQAAVGVYASLSDGERLEMNMWDRCGIRERPLGTDIPAGEIAESLRAELERRHSEEIARGMSLVGPHRDDIVFTVEGHDARTFASQGQQRTIALAWKWAEVAVVREVVGKAPILLLDDVMSELDSTRRAALTELMQQDIQTFITTTNTGYFDPALLRSALIIPVGGGE
jgi:DNA replication and repair protein RecF